MFTLDNTDGSFTKSDCDLMNQAVAVLMERGIDEKNASDRVNNNWQPTGNTVESLTEGSSGSNSTYIISETLNGKETYRQEVSLENIEQAKGFAAAVRVHLFGEQKIQDQAGRVLVVGVVGSAKWLCS